MRRRGVGAALGTVIGFAVGYGIALVLETNHETAVTLCLLFWFTYATLLIVEHRLVGLLIAGGSLGMTLGVLRGAYALYDLGVRPLGPGFTLFFPLWLAVPFAVCGAVIGYNKLGAARGRKGDEARVERVEERRHAQDERRRIDEDERRREEERRRHEKEQRRREEERHREEERRRRQEEERQRQEEERREQARAWAEQESEASETYYDILGVGRNATQDEIKKAYLQKSQRYHPDKYMTEPTYIRKHAEEISKKLNAAFEVLGNPQKRQEYDRGL